MVNSLRKKIKISFPKIHVDRIEHNFSVVQALIFVLVFAGVGGYIIWRSLAATPVVATLQAEQMTLPLGAAVYSDSTASGGQAVKLSTDGTLTGSVGIPSGSSATSLAVTAKANSCRGVANFSLAVDGTQVIGTTTASTSGWSSYSNSSNVNLNSGTHTIKITGNNVGSSHRCHRYLYIDVTNLYGITAVAAPTIAFSASPTNVSSGQASTLTWTSTNATSCTASGAWTGPEATSGSQSTGALNANSVYNLSCTGTGGTANASVAVTVTPSGGSGGNLTFTNFKPINTRAAILMSYGGVNISGWSNLNQYDFLVDNAPLLSSNSGSYLNSLGVVAKQPGVSINYFDPWTAVSAYNQSVDYTQAQNSGWFAHTSSGQLIGAYGHQPSTEALLDLTNPAVLNQMIANAKQTAANFPGLKGFLLDNVLPNYTSETTGYSYGSYPATVYPSEAAWQSAVLNMVKVVGGALRQAGFFVVANMSGYSQQPGYNEGTYGQSWLSKIAQTGGVDAVQDEYWMQDANNLTTMRCNTPNYPCYFQGWLDYVKTANQNDVQLFPEMEGTSTNQQAMRYIKASFMLEWDGVHGGVIFAVSPAYSSTTDPWNGAWTQDIGAPTAPYTVQSNGVYTRTFSGGWVAVNPTTSAQSVTMNGNAYNVAATDAIIHVGP